MMEMNKVKLICLPYAGGSASVFAKWRQYLDPMIELKPIELAGRGRRIQDEMYDNLDEAIEDVYQLIRPDIESGSYVLTGHSLGAKMCYFLAQKIRKANLPMPLHIFFSGTGAPHLKSRDDKKYHLMDDETFRKEVLELGGTPPEFFEYPELLELFIPLLKNDFKIFETHPLREEIRPLDQDISVFLGNEDDLTEQQCTEWVLHTSRKCDTSYFEGGHFFIHDHVEEITKKINKRVLESLTAAVRIQ